MLKRFLPLLVLSLSPSVAYAHVGVGDTHGFVHGFTHPLTGIDHILAMVAVGMFAAHLGGRAIWLVPASFVAVMALAGVAGAASIPVPFVETGIACTVIALGLIVAFEVRLPVVGAMALVGFFAIFHGHAHGAELPEDASGLAYGAGFMIATAVLHAAGVRIGLSLGHASKIGGERVLQVSGCAMSLAGAGILLGLL